MFYNCDRFACFSLLFTNSHVKSDNATELNSYAQILCNFQMHCVVMVIVKCFCVYIGQRNFIYHHSTL